MTDLTSNTSYRLDIQGLRAVAIALVVLAHAKVPGFGGGFVGVDVFFVLSGYLITGLLVQERMSTGRIRYVTFLARRLKRLLPALLVMLVLVLLAASLLLTAYETRMQTGSFMFSATWTSNLFFAFVDRDYFSALQADDLYLHTWSLGIEEQFYLVWPWLMMGSFLLFADDSSDERKRIVLLRVLATLFVLSFLLCLFWSNTRQLLSFYMMPARAWQFSLGAAVFLWFRFRDDTGRLSGTLAGGIGLLTILASSVFLGPDLVYPGYYALFPSVGASLVIAAGARDASTGISGWLASPSLVWLGNRSYSLYLWHWPLLLLGKSFGLTDSGFGVALLIGLAVLLSMASYRFVELPFWKGRWSDGAPSRVILLSVVAVAAAAVVSERLESTVFAEPEVMTVAGYNPRTDATPALYAAGLNCDTGPASAQLVPCGLGSKDGRFRAILLGDSVGAQWTTMIASIFASPDWQVIVLTKSACPVVDESYFYDKIGADYAICTEWRNAAIEYIGQLNPDIVFIGSSAEYPFSESQWVEGTSRVLSRLSEITENVVIIPGNPKLSFNGPSCLDQPYKFSYRLRDSQRECEEVQFTSTSDEVAGYLKQSARTFSNANVLDLNDLVCPGRRCAARREDGMPIYRDELHLTRSFVNAQALEARKRLVAMGIVAGDSSTSSMDSVSTRF